jgi:hypothetical protein
MASSKRAVMIPVYINTFNRLTTTRNLVEQVKRLGNAQPVVIDNDSDYEPLLDWYESKPCDIVRLKENLGHHAPWTSGIIEGDNADLYVVTDCDIDIEGVPFDMLSVLESAFRWPLQTPIKSGLALRINDLPTWQTKVIEWESRWWRHRVHKMLDWYRAPIDTTFALYQRGTTMRQVRDVASTPSVRLGGEYQARHMPWYLDGENLDEENANYFATANASNSWKPSGKSLTAGYAGARHAPRRV